MTALYAKPWRYPDCEGGGGIGDQLPPSPPGLPTKPSQEQQMRRPGPRTGIVNPDLPPPPTLTRVAAPVGLSPATIPPVSAQDVANESLRIPAPPDVALPQALKNLSDPVSRGNQLDLAQMGQRLAISRAASAGVPPIVDPANPVMTPQQVAAFGGRYSSVGPPPATPGGYGSPYGTLL